VTLRGLMAIPAPSEHHADQLKVFGQLADLKESIAADHPQVDTLSMGMTDDMTAAIEAGATFVRIGTAIFGARESGDGG